jgi:hypothetical protein
MTSANERPRPVCGGAEYSVYSGEKLDQDKITDMPPVQRREVVLRARVDARQLQNKF